MRKILFLIALLFATQAFASDPVLYQDPYLYYRADRPPTATEPVISSDGTDGCCFFSWFDISVTPNKEYRFLGGTNGSYVWQLLDNSIYVETTKKINAFTIFKSTTTDGSGNAIVYLTDDGLSTGNALFPNGADLNTLRVNFRGNSTPLYVGTPTLTNSNKTLTVPVTKSNVLTILGLDVLSSGTIAATSASVYLTISGN